MLLPRAVPHMGVQMIAIVTQAGKATCETTP
jgi:hypothetical protein